MLLLVIGLGLVKGHHRHGAQGFGDLVLSLDKGGIVKLGAPSGQGPQGLAFKISRAVVGSIHRFHRTRPVLSNTSQLAARHNDAVGVDHAHGTTDVVLHLENNPLEHPA